MGLTPVSGSTPYCTPAQFLNYFDARTVGDLVDDTGNRVSPSQLLTNAVLQQMLAEASGEVEAACLMGNRYAVTDLQALNGNSATFLAGIVAGIAYLKLLERRPDLDFDTPPMAARADKFLQALSLGHRILAFQETANAGQVLDDYESPSIVNQIEQVSWHARRFFGRRTSRIPIRPVQGNLNG